MKFTRQLFAMLVLAYAAKGQAAGQEDKAIQDTVKIHTESDLAYSDLRKGLPKERIEIGIPGGIVLRYDALTNLAPTDNNVNIAGIFLNKIVDDTLTNTKAGAAVINLNAETFLDLWATRKYGSTIAGLEIGASGRATSIPRSYAMVALKNISITGGLEASIEYGFMTKDPLQNEGAARNYGYIAVDNAHFFASYGNEIHNKHVMVGVNNYAPAAYFAWLKLNPDNTGHIKNRIAIAAFGKDVDRTFFDPEANRKNMKDQAIPSFFAPYLYGAEKRGPITAGIDFYFDKDALGNRSTTMKLMPGMETPIGQIAVGTETRYKNNSSTTGMSLAGFETYSVAGKVSVSAEVSYSAINHCATAHVTVDIPVK